MFGWGQVVAFEAQEIIYYALAGNIVLNNCLNARVRHAVLAENCGEMAVPQPNYFLPASFGSLELCPRAETEFIGQPISYDAGACVPVPMINLDSLSFGRLDLIKLDVEGMELAVLRGGRTTLARHHPIMLIEVTKSDKAAIDALLAGLDYTLFYVGFNVLAVHRSDPTLQQIKVVENQPAARG